jgi:hypothetical protein
MLTRILIVWIVYAGVMGFAVGGSFVAAYQITLPQHETSAEAEQGSANQNTKEKSEDALARYTFWLTICTGVMAFATIALGIATIGLYATGEKQIEVALKIANAADLSARAAIGVELPVIIIGTPELWGSNHQGGGGVGISGIPRGYIYFKILHIAVGNGGRTPGFPSEISLGYQIGEKISDIPNYSWSRPISTANTLRPDKTLNLDCSDFFISVTADQSAQLSAGTHHLWCYGAIVYSDFLGNRHEHGFLWVWGRPHGMGQHHFGAPAIAPAEYVKKT